VQLYARRIARLEIAPRYFDIGHSVCKTAYASSTLPELYILFLLSTALHIARHLLASASVTSMRGLRIRMRCNQEALSAPRLAACRHDGTAAMINQASEAFAHHILIVRAEASASLR
jgi:hypothetical protein